MNKKLVFIYTKIFPGFFASIGIIVWWNFTPVLSLAMESENWPSTSGKVIESKRINTTPGFSGTNASYKNILRYSYEVENEAYIGKVHFLGEKYTGGESRYYFLHECPVGKQVKVFYSPENPTIATLKTGMKLEAFFTPGISLIFFVAGIVMFIFLPKSIKY
ncbi:MAG: DUF3592 domain-containing protein [Lentisphaeraceae bacterium]|nr:DUF3592 domain-containing protein [Lentisphaeraceae bacterium]